MAMALALAQYETVHLISQSTDKYHRFDLGSEVQDYLPYPRQTNEFFDPIHHLIIPKRPSTHTSTHQKGYYTLFWLLF